MVSGEEPPHNNSGRGALVSYRQREMGAGGQGTHYLYQPAGVHCGCGRKRLCSRSGCGAGMALGLGARAAVRCAAAEAPSSRWLGSAPPRATRRHLPDGKTAPEPGFHRKSRHQKHGANRDMCTRAKQTDQIKQATRRKMAMLHRRQARGRDIHKHFSLAPARSHTKPPSNPQSAPDSQSPTRQGPSSQCDVEGTTPVSRSCLNNYV